MHRNDTIWSKTFDVLNIIFLSFFAIITVLPFLYVIGASFATEGEIVDIIHRNAGATTIDGVKRRARPGGGRCQGGFCQPKVMEILARELDIDITEVLKDKLGSNVAIDETKE